MSSPSTTLIRVFPEKFIEFPLCLYSTLKTKLQLENISPIPTHVAFKIKTTAPKSYLVRPSTGVIPPGGSQEIEIALQPLTQDPISGQDRFLVQAAAVESEHQVLARDYWSTVEKASLQEQRMSVTFRKVEGAGGASEELGGSGLGMGATMSAGGVGERSGAASGYFTTADVAATTSDRPTVAGRGTSTAEYKSMYEELVKYCLSLEKKNLQLSRDLEAVSKREGGGAGGGKEELGGGDGVVSGGGSKIMGLEFWHWFLILVVGIIALKVAGKL